MSEPSAESPPKSAAKAFADGLRSAFGSVFFYVLLGNYLGIGALAHEFNFSVLWMVLSTILIWAAPAQLILISTLGTSTLIEVAIAVTLSSVRFLPMVAGLLPTLRAEGTRQRDLVLPMHFTAISVWVEGLRLAGLLPRAERVAFYNGLGTGLMFSAAVASAGGYYLAATLPPLLAAALLFFTPMAVLMVSARNSRTLLDGLSFGLGLVVWPAVAAMKLGLELMWTGLIAGTIAYVVHRVREGVR
ncbi:MAG: AzlC family ABC transporter permease [Alphaproteobacteria bacterium]|nr:AzlC family ABC transporter permease [Alphaproteobacteria bacterium]